MQNQKIMIDVTIRPQVAVMGRIDLTDQDFTLEEGSNFYIKNEGSDPVLLDVVPAGNADGDFIQTTFFPGWSVEVVKRIKQSSDKGLNLLFGY